MTYITINNEVINTETGEVIGTVEQFNSAVAFLSQDVEEVVKNAVEEICSEFEVSVSSDPILTTSFQTLDKNGQKRGGARNTKVFINPFVHQLHEVEVSGWLDDILTGAARLATDNTINNKWDLWRVVKNVETITTTSLQTFFAKLQKPIGVRQAQRVAAQVRSLIKSMEYHLAQGKDYIYRDDFNFAEDAAGYLAIREDHINWVSPITDEQRKTILDAYKPDVVVVAVLPSSSVSTSYGNADWLSEL